MSNTEPIFVATSINALGLDLLRRAGAPDSNALFSPYSIQSAMALAFAGSAGATREEMANVLYYPMGDDEVHRSFRALRQALDGVVDRSVGLAGRSKRMGVTSDPITMTVANRLFGQAGYDFRAPFLALVKDYHDAPFETLDFIRDAAGATKRINDWVDNQTRERIRDLIPAGALDAWTRLVLVNAIYLKAPWTEPFPDYRTAQAPFHVAGARAVEVPTMTDHRRFPYARRRGFVAVAIPYIGDELQFLILLPDKVNGLADLESTLTADLLADCVTLPRQDVILYLPKFKVEPPLMRLGEELRALGMKSAFNDPPGSANFDRIAPGGAAENLFIKEVFHKTFLELDENGTEAAAATAMGMVGAIALEMSKPIEVRVDRPFVFAIQHRPSGACLFLGRMTDPRLSG